MIKQALVIAWILTLVGCASTSHTVTSNADPATDFRTLQTFDFMQPLGTDRPGGVRTPLSNMLVAAVSRELEARGMQRSETPDVLVNLFVTTEQRLDIRQVPTASSFNTSWRGRYQPWRGYETQIREFTQGTLFIDLVSPARSMLVWEGVAQGRLGRGSTSVDQARIDEVVADVLNALPR